MTNTKMTDLMARLNATVKCNTEHNILDGAIIGLEINGQHVSADFYDKMLEVLKANLDSDQVALFTKSMIASQPFTVNFEKGVTATLRLRNRHISPYDIDGFKIANSERYNTVKGSL